MELLIERPNTQLSPEQITSNLQLIRAYVLKRIAKGGKFTLKDVSEALELSEYNITKILIKGAGQTFKTFLLNCKAEHIKSREPVSSDTLGNARTVSVCLSARKSGVDLFHLSPKHARLR